MATCVISISAGWVSALVDTDSNGGFIGRRGRYVEIGVGIFKRYTFNVGIVYRADFFSTRTDHNASVALNTL